MLVNDSFSDLLNECRNDALSKLRSNERYIERKKAQEELLSQLEAMLSPEAAKLLEEYTEAAFAVQNMESNIIFLRGLVMRSDINKLFDASTPEYTELVKQYL